MANDASDGYKTPSNPPPFVRIDTYSPDQQQSSSKLFMKEIAVDQLLWLMQARGLGVMVLRTSLADMSITMAIFDKGDIGPCPNV